MNLEFEALELVTGRLGRVNRIARVKSRVRCRPQGVVNGTESQRKHAGRSRHSALGG